MNKRKVPVKIIVLLTGGILLLVLAFGIFFKMFANHRFVKAYEGEEYLTETEEMLTAINVPESYLPYYNLGNVAFENTDYNSAVGYYTKALTLFPMGQKECDIRINLALSMCYSIDFQHLESQERIDTALLILYKARDILLENGWANEEPELAKDAEAQQLKEDIDRMIEELENPDKGDDSQDNADQDDQDQNQDEDDSDDQSKGGPDREKKKQDELEENKKNAMEERQRQQGDLQKWGSNDDADEEGAGGGGGQYKPW